MASSSLPTSQRAALLTPPAGTKPVVSQTAAVPQIPTSGVYTFIRVTSAAINPVDYKMANLPGPIARFVLGAAPVIPATDFVGRVWQTSHPDLKAGDIVWGRHSLPGKWGSCAEFTCHKGSEGIANVPEGFLPLVDQGRSLDELAGVGVAGLTALQSLRQGGIGGGSKVFINGASGGTGTFAVQFAKAMGCSHIVASCSGSNAELVRSLGATEVIDYRSQDVLQSLSQWSQSHGKFDAVINNTEETALYYGSHNFLKEDGKWMQVGGGAGSIIGLAKMMLLPTFLGGGKRPAKMYMLQHVPKNDLDTIGQWMVEGKVRTIIEDENKFDLANVEKAFQKLHAGRTRGKIIVNVAKESH